jgi:hypothetical protein
MNREPFRLATCFLLLGLWAQAESNPALLSGLISLPDLKRVLLERGLTSGVQGQLILEVGQKVGDLEVIQIDLLMHKAHRSSIYLKISGSRKGRERR